MVPQRQFTGRKSSNLCHKSGVCPSASQWIY